MSQLIRYWNRAVLFPTFQTVKNESTSFLYLITDAFQKKCQPATKLKLPSDKLTLHLAAPHSDDRTCWFLWNNTYRLTPNSKIVINICAFLYDSDEFQQDCILVWHLFFSVLCVYLWIFIIFISQRLCANILITATEMISGQNMNFHFSFINVELFSRTAHNVLHDHGCVKRLSR